MRINQTDCETLYKLAKSTFHVDGKDGARHEVNTLTSLIPTDPKTTFSWEIKSKNYTYKCSLSEKTSDGDLQKVDYEFLIQEGIENAEEYILTGCKRNGVAIYSTGSACSKTSKQISGDFDRAFELTRHAAEQLRKSPSTAVSKPSAILGLVGIILDFCRGRTPEDSYRDKLHTAAQNRIAGGPNL